jgi:tetratricopeptide (TPR) repeat protein
MQITTSNEYRQADIWLGEAYAAYRIGDNELALARYGQVLDVDPTNRNALLARAAIRMQDGQINSAIKDYQALLLANPTDSQAMSSLLAVADYSPRETESQLKLMIRADPQSPYLNFALANVYGAQKRWQEAQRHYFTALQNNPDDPNYAYNLAVSLEHISQPSSAITYYQRALDNFTNGLATFNRDIVNQRLEMLGQL